MRNPPRLSTAVHILCQPTFNPNHQNTDGLTVLTYCGVYHSSLDIVQKLIERGAHVNYMNKGRSVLTEARDRAPVSSEYVRCLLNAGFDIKKLSKEERSQLRKEIQECK